MVYIENRNPDVVQRFLRLFRRKEQEIDSVQRQFLPVVVINDKKENQVFSLNAERTTSGTTNLLTTPVLARQQRVMIVGYTITLASQDDNTGA